MRLNERQMEWIARAVVRRLRDHEVAEVLDAERIKDDVKTVLAENVDAELALEEEARQLMKQHDMTIRRGDVDYHELFKKIKRKLAEDRGFIL